MTLSLVLVITTIYVLYLNYLLLGQFFFCLFLAQITSTTLRPYRDVLIDYFARAYLEWDYIFMHSFLYRILLEIGVFFRTLWVERSLIEACHLVFVMHTSNTF